MMANFRSVQWSFFWFVHVCGMMTHSEVLVAKFESGTRITFDSNLLNLEKIWKLRTTQGNAIHILRNFLFTSLSRSRRFDGEGHMDGPEQSKHGSLSRQSIPIT